MFTPSPDVRYKATAVLKVSGLSPDGGRRGLPDDHAGPLPDVPVGGVRAAAGEQVRGGGRRARGARVHAHLQRRLHGRQEHRAAHGRLPRAQPAALLLQRQALRLLHLRGGGQAGALRGLLRGRGARPAAGQRRPRARPQAAAAALKPLRGGPPPGTSQRSQYFYCKYNFTEVL